MTVLNEIGKMSSVGGLRPQSYSLLMWLVLWLAACGSSPPEPPPPEFTEDGGWAKVRGALLKGSNCYRKFPKYCPRKPELIDGLIRSSLQELQLDAMPRTLAGIQPVIQQANTRYGRWQRTGPGLVAVQEAVAAYYANPLVKIVDGKGANVAVGVPRGRLSLAKDGRALLLRSSLVVDDEWASPEVGTAIQRTLDAHPDLDAVRLVIHVPTAGGAMRQLDYRYSSDERRVEVRDPVVIHEGWRSSVIEDWSQVIDGSLSLKTADLQRCPSEVFGRPLNCPEGKDQPQSMAPSGKK